MGPAEIRYPAPRTSAGRTSTNTVTRTGTSERTVREDVQTGESIPEDVGDAIRDTPLAGAGEARPTLEPTGP